VVAVVLVGLDSVCRQYRTSSATLSVDLWSGGAINTLDINWCRWPCVRPLQVRERGTVYRQPSDQPPNPSILSKKELKSFLFGFAFWSWVVVVTTWMSFLWAQPQDHCSRCIWSNECVQRRSNRPPYPPIGGGPANKGVPRILLTTPVTVASAERSFSRLKLIKNILRSTITNDRFSALAIISVVNKIVRSFDYDALIKQFAENKARKKRFAFYIVTL